ncbi:hypothetical protein Tco_0382862 [Tanacetum coccineum]
MYLRSYNKIFATNSPAPASLGHLICPIVALSESWMLFGVIRCSQTPRLYLNGLVIIFWTEGPSSSHQSSSSSLSCTSLVVFHLVATSLPSASYSYQTKPSIRAWYSGNSGPGHTENSRLNQQCVVQANLKESIIRGIVESDVSLTLDSPDLSMRLACHEEIDPQSVARNSSSSVLRASRAFSGSYTGMPYSECYCMTVSIHHDPCPPLEEAVFYFTFSHFLNRTLMKIPVDHFLYVSSFWLREDQLSNQESLIT